MGEIEDSDSVIHRRFTQELQHVRERQNIRLETIAEALHTSTSKISRIFKGTRFTVPSYTDLTAILNVMRIEGAEREALLDADLRLLTRRMYGNPYRKFSDILSWEEIGLYDSLRCAPQLILSSGGMIPILLRSAAYIASLEQATWMDDVIRRAALNELLIEDLNRPERREGLTLFMSESALHRATNAQIAHAITRAEQYPVQIATFTQGFLPAMRDTGFLLIWPDEPALTQYAYMTPLGDLGFAEDSEIPRVLHDYARLLDLSLTPGESLTFMKDHLKLREQG